MDRRKMLPLHEKIPADAPHILIIEDDELVARTLERGLRRHGLRATLAGSGVEGLKAARRRVPDLIILDIILPGMDGYRVCQEIRSDPILQRVPVLFLTAKAREEERIAGFTLGADDYVCKPFNLDELVLRLKAILRRAAPRPSPSQTFQSSEVQAQADSGNHNQCSENEQSPAHILRLGGYQLDQRVFTLTTPWGKRVQLTPMQFELLSHLMHHAGEVFTPARLLDEVWDYPSHTGSQDLVRVHIKNLRQRIEKEPRNPQFIRTVPGFGYTISAEGS